MTGPIRIDIRCRSFGRATVLVMFCFNVRMERRSGSIFRGLPLAIIVISAIPLIVICGGFGVWLVLPVLQGGERWTSANQTCPVLDTTIAARLGVVAQADEQPTSGVTRKSRCSYRAAGDDLDAAGLRVVVTTHRAGRLQNAHEQALDVIEKQEVFFTPIGAQREDQIFGEETVSVQTVLMVSVIDNASIEIDYRFSTDQISGEGKTALRDPLQSVTDQAVANLG
ncbi:hypothetical protein [Actinoplanes flavus]|uniref:Uncharacterized protein n=1 Tax=Actinoplanes flavus TaxID=2820290 RepID=A0ABS3UDT1_9ACTN|nr:hypothetical protein [Actinoplanes flavus]MBO3736941.1 hypothetical protein [Actinoplanes flavus]